MFELLSPIWAHIEAKRKLQFFLLLFLSVIASLAEIISIGSVIPFVAILFEQGSGSSNEIVHFFFNTSKKVGLELTAKDVFLFVSLFAIISALIRVMLVWIYVRTGNFTGAELSEKAFDRLLSKKYEYQLLQSSDNLISALTQKVNATTQALIACMTVMSSGILFIVIFGTLLYLSGPLVFITGIAFAIAYLALSMMTKSRLRRNSKTLAESQSNLVKSVQEGVGAIRDIIIDNAMRVYRSSFIKAAKSLALASAENQFINRFPRFLFDAIAIMLIGYLTLMLSEQTNEFAEVMPILAAITMGAQRLLPIAQQIYSNWAVVMGYRESILDVQYVLNDGIELPVDIDRLRQAGDEFDNDKSMITDPLVFHSLEFKGVRYAYPKANKRVFENLNLKIQKGERVGVIGSTGSGKSTLIDLILSLLTPTSGVITINGEELVGAQVPAWQKSLAHVPQDVYLTNDTIAQNIAFTVKKEDINYDRLALVVKKAQLHDLIQHLPEGLNSIVGERGVTLSGGQKQRIGIARALYKGAKVILFDEATSALDNETESVIMDAIYSLDRELTIIIVAHRVSTLSMCDRIIEVKNGAVQELELGVNSALSNN